MLGNAAGQLAECSSNQRIQVNPMCRAVRSGERDLVVGLLDRQRPGFTLVELLVSVFVLTVGLLALTGASAVVAQQIGGGAQLTLAATTAQSRFEALRGSDCATLASGASERGGIRERWSVTRAGIVLEVSDTVSIAGRVGRRVHVFHTAIPCRPRP